MNRNAIAVITSTICSSDYYPYVLGSIVEFDNDTLEHRFNAIGSIVDVTIAHYIRIDNYDRPSSRGLVLLCRFLIFDAVWLKLSC